jgi:Right handed beta helix region/Secretion system C-terminal sorting domain
MKNNTISFWSFFLGLFTCLLLPQTGLRAHPSAPAATSYYADAVSGNDANNGLSANTAWQTINKINRSTFKAGDNILFKCGQTFYGALRPANSGLNYGSYGSGAKPVISGITILSGWSNAGGGVYEAPCVSCKVSLTLLTVNDTLKAMGRYPNAGAANGGYLTVDTHAGNTSITDPHLPAAPDWTGAELVIKKNSWTIDRGIVSAHSKNTLTYASIYGGGFDSQNGYGYFIQNSPFTLDAFGEWYYNHNAGKLSMFFGARNPAIYTVKTATIDTLVYLDAVNDVSFTGLAFEGSTIETFRIQNANNITLRNCNIAYSGFYAVKDSNSVNLVINNCSIDKTNNTAIEGYACNHASITNNTIRNTGMLTGMGGRNNQPYKAIACFGTGNTITGNHIDSTGYMGIFFYGDSAIVKNNYINFFATVLDDGGGIYTFGGYNNYGRIISKNIIINGIGAPAGTPFTQGAACGIYTDDRSANLQIDSNTVAYCVRAGLFLHNTHETGINANTLYGNGTQLLAGHDAGYPTDEIRNLVFKKNLLLSTSPDQFISSCYSTADDFSRFGDFDSNYYARPFDTAGIINTVHPENNNSVSSYYDLPGWKTAYGLDRNSAVGRPIAAYKTDTLTGNNIFANGSFNSNTDGVFCLSSPGTCSVSWSGGGHLDNGAVQVTYNTTAGPNQSLGVYFNIGSVEANNDYVIKFSLAGDNIVGKTFEVFLLRSSQSLQNHSSSRFYKVSNNRTENEYLFHATANETLILALALTKADTAFWIDNVQLRKAVITPTVFADSVRFFYNAAATTTPFLFDGAYRDIKNKLFFSRINLAPFSSVVLMRVWPTPNQPPEANAGNDTTLFLPANTMLLNGTASVDYDGQIVSYAWKQLDGPSSLKINGAITPTARINELQEGDYRFQITVTDNAGDSSVAVVKIKVVNKYHNSSFLRLYPNPTTGQLYCQYIDDYTGKIGLLVFDGLGRKIKYGNLVKDLPLITQALDMSRLSAGLYYLQLTGSNGVKTINPFIKQ